ncbi:hypothetical protein [Chitinophaga pinensis]|uniref:hypothetical protein n=1 Tax=Chitinophaga pinensis TaxID=79329 RepID=UPI0021BD8D68|nr:hypothetical protein [Chitinophaga pinensis]
MAAFTIVPRHVLGRGYLAPSDQLTKGVIGTGGMGKDISDTPARGWWLSVMG